MSTKFCPSCKQVKLHSEFGKNRARSKWDGLDSHCKQCNRIRQVERYKKNPRKDYFFDLRHKPEYRANQNLRRRERWQIDLNFKLANNLRTRLYIAIRDSQRVGSAVEDLGCSIDEFKLYVENKFDEGMTWDNWSEDGWHIDHVIPLASFDLTDRNQFLNACHYTNLQPLWAVDNRRKGCRV